MSALLNLRIFCQCLDQHSLSDLLACGWSLYLQRLVYLVPLGTCYFWSDGWCDFMLIWICLVYIFVDWYKVYKAFVYVAGAGTSDMLAGFAGIGQIKWCQCTHCKPVNLPVYVCISNQCTGSLNSITEK